MSKLKISENLFLEVAELNRLVKFLEDDGFKRHFLLNTDSFGIIRQANLPEIGNIEIENAFYVEKAGTPFDEVVVNPGVAIDGDANLIINEELKNLKVPNDGLWYWIKINHNHSNKEKGTVSVDSLGNVVGVGTKFTEIFRGQPNFPTKIKFLNSGNGNADIYEVVKVVDDNNMILQGDFIAESGLEFAVHGTFTPGYIPTNENKLIYNYDSTEFSLQAETVLNQPPPSSFPISLNNINKEFYIARVRNNGINLQLQDKRINWWRSEAMQALKDVNRNLENPLIGVEALKWDVKTSTRAKNWVELAWGFRFSSYTIDTSSKRVSILIGNGGVYKDTSLFQNGDFDGWRLYAKDGSYQTIIDSIKSGTQIVITLDVLVPDDYGIEDLLFIAPPFEEVEIKVRVNEEDESSKLAVIPVPKEVTPIPNMEQIFNFSMNVPLARFQVAALDDCWLYNFTFRYKIFNDYTDWQTFPDDAVGLWKEKSFDENGNLKPEPIDRERYPYAGHPTNGFIKICEHEYSFDNFQEYIDTGDLYGVKTNEFTNAEPVVHLEVGKSKQYQHFKGNNFTLNGDIYINLKRYRDVNGDNIDDQLCREGNKFWIHIEQFIDLSTFKLRIVEDYENPTVYTTLAELTANEMMFIRNNVNPNNNQKRGLFIVCTFNDLGHWVCHFETDVTPKGTIRMLRNVAANNFNDYGEGIKPGYWGWKILQETNDLLIKGTNEPSNSMQIGGQDNFSLSLQNIPRFRLPINVRNTKRGAGNDPNDAIANPSGDSFGGNSTIYTEYIGGDAAGQTKPVTFEPRHIKILMIEKIV